MVVKVTITVTVLAGVSDKILNRRKIMGVEKGRLTKIYISISLKTVSLIGMYLISCPLFRIGFRFEKSCLFLSLTRLNSDYFIDELKPK